MRSGVGTGNSVLCTIPSGTQIKVTEVKSDAYYNWGYTTYNGKSGWVAMTYCECVQATTAAPTTQPTTVAPTTVAPTTEPVTTKPSGLGVGEIDCNGIINIFDVTLLQKYLSDLTTLTDEQISYCDFNFDGRISVMDATSMQTYLTY